MIGKTIGHYEITEKIGEGGMGVVYKAEDTTLHRLVALKTLSGHLTEDEEAQERFIREAQSASSLNHPNITTVHEFIEEGDTRLICMEYVEGKTIRDMVESGVVSVRKAIDIIMQAAEALDAAHNKGILHRDVKSANIMVNMEGRVKVMDFGLAHLESRSQLTRTGTTMGTLSYSSPEQISGKPVDRRSEIFSLGVVFYELLTGQLPFKAANEAEILFAIINNEPMKLSKVRDDVPELVEAVVSRMLEKDPELRYPTCGEVINDLKGIRKEMETSTVGITGVLGRMQASRKKVMIQRLAIGVASVAVIIVGLVLLLNSGPNLDPNGVIVIPFVNRDNDETLDPLRERLVDHISQGLGETGLMQVVEPSISRQIADAVEARAEDEPHLNVIEEIANQAGVGTVVSGSYFVGEDGNLQFQIWVNDYNENEEATTLKVVSGPRDRSMELFEEIRQRVMGALAFRFDPSHNHYARFTQPPPTYDAYLEYSEAWNLASVGATSAAGEYMERAASHDSTYYLPNLIIAWYASRSQSVANHAVADSLFALINPNRERLAQLDLLLLDYGRAMLARDTARMYKVSEVLGELSPQFWGFSFIEDATFSNRPEAAVRYFEKYQKQLQQNIWLNLVNVITEAYYMLEEYRDELRVARQGRQGRETDLDLVRNEIRALIGLKRIEEVDRLVIESQSYVPDLSKSYTYGDLLFDTASNLRAQGYTDKAMEMARKAMQWYETRPEEDKATPGYRNFLANIHYFLGEWDECEMIQRELFEEVGLPSGYSHLRYLGAIAARKGDQDEARRCIQQLKELDESYFWGRISYSQACIYSLLGEKQMAVDLLVLAFENGKEYGFSLYYDKDLDPLRTYPPFEELIRPKG